MTEHILQWVRTIVIYLILVSAVMHVLPDNQYKKYVQLFVGLLLILIVVGPVGEVFGDGHLVDILYEKAVEWQEKSERDRVLEKIDDTGKETILNTYEKALKERLTEQLENEGYMGSDIQVELSEEKIEKIKMELSSGKTLDKEEKDREEKRLTELFCEIYQVPAGTVNIRIGQVGL